MNRNHIILALTEGTPQMSKKLATRIIDALYAKGLDAKDFDAILWRLRRKMEREELAKLMEAATAETIAQLVDEMLPMRLPSAPSADCSCSEGSFLSELSLAEGKTDYKAGDTIDVQILRTGKWKHERYGTFEVTTKALSEMIENFEANVRGIKIFADEDHEPQHKALSEFKKLFKKGKDQLWATMSLTAKGAQLLNEGAYHYFSSEFARIYKDIESGKTFRNLVLGGAFTNRPVVKGMAPILASETGSGIAADDDQANADPSALLVLSNPSVSMKNFLDQLDSLVGKETITASEKAAFEANWAKLSEEQKEIPEYKKAHADVMALALAEDGEEGGDKDEEEGGEEGKKETPKPPVEASERKPSKKPAKKAPAAEENVELTLSERDELIQLRASKAEISQRENEIRLSEAEDAADVAFGEGSAIQLTPVSRTKLAKFAVSLSEAQETKLWDILKEVQVVALGELGIGTNEDGTVVLSETHPEIKKLLAAGYELSEAQEIAAAATSGKPLEVKPKKKDNK